jgi:Uma2 family endonuclease
MYALAGASLRHDQIVVNLVSDLRPIARGTDRRVHTGEVMVRVSNSRYYYPDLHVNCESLDGDSSVVDHPCVVVQVLSPSTEGTDRREKLFAYRQIEALRMYLIVHQDEPVVEVEWLDDGVWRHDILEGDGTIRVPCLDVDLSLATIYEDVAFDHS